MVFDNIIIGNSLFVNVVLCFFSLLIIVSILNYVNPVMKEGATGSCDLDNDPTYLAKVNAANIKAMKDDIGEVKKLKEDIDILTELVGNNSTSIKKMGEALQEKSSELTGGLDPESGDELPSVTGME
tara:strand:- start:1457 stop:1837 length:381 start_codon:yes stop_codon:yes gene_type:complete